MTYLMEKLAIKIVVDNEYVDLDKYKCIFVGKETKRKAPTINTVKIPYTVNRYISEIEDNEDELILTFILTGKEHQFIWENAREFSNLLKTCTIKIDTDSYYYECILAGYDDEFLNWNELKLTLRFNALCFGQVERYNVLGLGNIFYIRGAKKTPLSFKIKAKTNVENFIVHNIRINRLNANEVLEIDSFNCRVLLNGQNAIDRVELYEFPYALGNTHIEVKTPNRNVEVEMTYRSRW